MRVLLHCCCGPCALYPARALRREGFVVEGFFYNPNIHPYLEHAKRLAAYQEMASQTGLAAIDQDDKKNLEYGLGYFMEEISHLGPGAYQPRSKDRCRVCYHRRLDKTADICGKLGYDAFSTSLLVSPYQDHEMIKSIGETIAAERGLSFLYRDFRGGFREGRMMAREMGLYAQGYCGCAFSEWERYGSKAN